MKCIYCGATLPPERCSLGYVSCACCVKLSSTLPQKKTAPSRKPKPKPKPKNLKVQGRFIVCVRGKPAVGFNSIPKAMLHASTLTNYVVRDRQKGGLGQIFPTPDRMAGTHQKRQTRY